MWSKWPTNHPLRSNRAVFRNLAQNVRKEGARPRSGCTWLTAPVIKLSIRIQLMHSGTQNMAFGHPTEQKNHNHLSLSDRSGSDYSSGAAFLTASTCACVCALRARLTKPHHAPSQYSIEYRLYYCAIVMVFYILVLRLITRS